jgi:hypothetical protein
MPGSVISLDPAKVFTEIRSLPAQQTLDAIRGMLTIFLPFGLHPDIDQVCVDKLGIPEPLKAVTNGLIK